MSVIVKQLWRYPVKSLGGEQLDRCMVVETGLEGDRRWGIVDCETGRVLTARREPGLLFAAARLLSPEEVEITLPDGRTTTEASALSEWLQKTVRLERAGESGGIYENPRDFENETEWISWQGPPEAWHDMKRARLSLCFEPSTVTAAAASQSAHS